MAGSTRDSVLGHVSVWLSSQPHSVDDKVFLMLDTGAEDSDAVRQRACGVAAARR